MRYFLIAGEPSGDLHASRLISALREGDPNAQFSFFGGDLMAAAAPGLVAHYRDLAIMGFLEVIRRLGEVRRRLQAAREQIAAYKPDLLILVDFGGFNLRIGRWAREQGIRVFYYIPPKLWAWGPWRVKGLRKSAERVYAIFPFEEEFFRARRVDVEYCGNPLLDLDNSDGGELPKGFTSRDKRPIVALLPGSRFQEIDYNLSRMLELPERFPSYRFVVCVAGSLPEEYVASRIPAGTRVEIVNNATRSVLALATAAVVTSGTATLEAALLNVPEVVVYRGAWPSMIIAKMLIRVRWISLVNLVLGRECLCELRQAAYTRANLERALGDVLPGGSRRDDQLEDFRELRAKLGGGGVARRVAASMLHHLNAGKSQCV